MTREYEPDEEVLADLRLREQTERDPTRTRGVGVYSWRPPEFMGAWRCRVPACRVLVPVTADDFERRAMFNAELKKRGDEPLSEEGIVFCDRCRAVFRETAPARRRAQVERMAVKIRELKECEDPRGAREIIEQLREWGHPDVDGLVQAVADRRAAERGSTRRRPL